MNPACLGDSTHDHSPVHYHSDCCYIDRVECDEPNFHGPSVSMVQPVNVIKVNEFNTVLS